RGVAHPAAEIRLAGAAGVRAGAHVQPVAQHSRAPAAGESKPRAQADVLRAIAVAAADEPGRALRADGRRDIHLMGHPEEERRGISVLDPALRSGEIPRYAQGDIWRRDIHLMCRPEEERRGISVLDPSLRSGEIPRYAQDDIWATRHSPDVSIPRRNDE